MSCLALSGRKSSLVKTFCEFCEQLDITHPSINMTRRFVIQGCPTLSTCYLRLIATSLSEPHTVHVCLLTCLDWPLTVMSALKYFTKIECPCDMMTCSHENESEGLLLDITHPSVHTTRRFVIQGCFTLMVSIGTCSQIGEILSNSHIIVKLCKFCDVRNTV